MSAVPGRAVPDPAIPHLDKAVHLLVYLVLGFACARGLILSGVRGRWSVLLAAAAMATGYGASDELHQMFVPGRAPDLADLGADALGALLGGALRARHALPPARRS